MISINVINGTLQDDFDSDEYEGFIHSIYNNAINVLFEIDNISYIITILKESTPLVVDSFNVCKEAFDYIHNLPLGCRVTLYNNRIIFNDLCLNYKKRNLTRLKNYKDINFKNLLKYEDNINGLSCIKKNKLEEIKISFNDYASTGNFDNIKKYTGYGLGLTPASDDVIVGITLILKQKNKLKKVDVKKIYKELKDSTTDISLKYLYAALNNNFSVTLLNILESVNDKKDLDKAVNRLKEVGSSSGNDMLQGMIIAIKQLFYIEENKCNK